MQTTPLPLLQPDHLSVRVNDAEQMHRSVSYTHLTLPTIYSV